MKILTLTANYPPSHSGGYGLRVKNILDSLYARGHGITVLTTIPENEFAEKKETIHYPVIRKLHNRYTASFFPKEILYDLLDTKVLEEQIQTFDPDILYLGHTYILSKALLPYLADRDIPILYDEGGSGLIEAWTEHGRWFRFTGDYRSRYTFLNAIKPWIIRAVCKISRGRITPVWTWPDKMQIVFNSELNRRQASAKGVPADHAMVIHSGIDTQKFILKPRTGFSTQLKIIVPGRIERRKGQLDGVYLLKMLLEEGIDTRMIFAGAHNDDNYYHEILDAIQNESLADKVTIRPMLTQDEMVRHYQEADICFFSSYQEIGFSSTPLEAMACGCIVISYGNEGSDEIINNGENGFLVPPGDYEAMKNLVTKLSSTPSSVTNITETARQEIENNCTLINYIDQIEAALKTLSKK